MTVLPRLMQHWRAHNCFTTGTGQVQSAKSSGLLINPNSALSHQQYSELLITTARFDESIAEEMRARELDPLSPQIAADLAYEYMVMRRYDESIGYSRKALELDPNLPISRANLAWAFAMKGMYPQAIAEYEKIPEQAKAVAAENQLVAFGLGWV